MKNLYTVNSTLCHSNVSFYFAWPLLDISTLIPPYLKKNIRSKTPRAPIQQILPSSPLPKKKSSPLPATQLRYYIFFFRLNIFYFTHQRKSGLHARQSSIENQSCHARISYRLIPAGVSLLRGDLPFSGSWVERCGRKREKCNDFIGRIRCRREIRIQSVERRSEF